MHYTRPSLPGDALTRHGANPTADIGEENQSSPKQFTDRKPLINDYVHFFLENDTPKLHSFPADNPCRHNNDNFNRMYQSL